MSVLLTDNFQKLARATTTYILPPSGNFGKRTIYMLLQQKPRTLEEIEHTKNPGNITIAETWNENVARKLEYEGNLEGLKNSSPEETSPVPSLKIAS